MCCEQGFIGRRYSLGKHEISRSHGGTKPAIITTGGQSNFIQDRIAAHGSFKCIHQMAPMCTTLGPHPKWAIDRFSRFCRAHQRFQQTQDTDSEGTLNILMLYIGRSDDVTESMATTRSPFCGYNTT